MYCYENKPGAICDEDKLIEQCHKYQDEKLHNLTKEELIKELQELNNLYTDEIGRRIEITIEGHNGFWNSIRTVEAYLNILVSEGLIEQKTKEIIDRETSLMLEYFKEYDKYYNN